jgi:glycosyltransferase involved in cell wall biosynthesis
VRVGLNLVFLVPGETGGRETYARELVAALRAERPDLDLVAFVNRETAASGDAFWGEAVTLPVHARRRAEWALGEQVALPRAARRVGVDVLHSLANTAPGWGPYRSVVTIHDLLYKRFPQYHSPAMRWGTSGLVSLAARRSDRIITVSEASRRELVELLGVPEAKIDVVPNGIGVTASAPGSGAPSRVDGEPQAGPALPDLGDRPLVLAVATRLRHKNLGALVEAMGLIDPAERPVLVMAGHPTDVDAELRARITALDLDADVRLRGAAAPDELEAVYAAADLVAHPSLYEGFGLPVLEAMARGVPVACSDIPPLREVAADAARYIDPHDPSTIAAAIAELLADPDERRRLAEAGRARAARFSWAKAARETAASYERALD